MSDRTAAGGMSGVEGILRREAEQLVRRFPHVDPDEILGLMRETYARLDQNATIKAHLVNITVGQVDNRLRKITRSDPPPDES